MTFQHAAARRRLEQSLPIIPWMGGFQHAAARRRLGKANIAKRIGIDVSTRSRPKAAGRCAVCQVDEVLVSTRSRPKAAGVAVDFGRCDFEVSTRSRPKAAGCKRQLQHIGGGCFNTQPPEGGWFKSDCAPYLKGIVSTRSRPKAAGRRFGATMPQTAVSTRSRPKAAGGGKC